MESSVGIERKSDFLKKVVETFATRILLFVIGLASSIVTARLLGPEGRGYYAMATMIGLVGVQIGNFGLHSSNIFYVARDRSILPALIGNSAFISLVVGTLGGLATWAFFTIWPSLAPLNGFLLIASLAWVPFGIAYLLMQNLLLGVQDVRNFNKIELYTRLLTVGLILLTATLGFRNPEAFFSIGLTTLIISLGWGWIVLKSHSGQPFSFSYSLFKSHLGYGLKSYFSSLFMFLVLRIDVFLVDRIAGKTAVGLYSMAMAMIDMVYTLPVVICTILFPTLSALATVQEKWKMTKEVLFKTSAALFLICLGAAFLAKPAIGLLYGSEFLGAAPAFIWLLPAIFIFSVSSVLSNFIAANQIPLSAVPFNLALAILNTLLCFILIPKYYIVGASMASLICYGLLLPYNVYYVVRILNKSK
jgi:O-antigen/teichoic acid export membrane protein